MATNKPAVSAKKTIDKPFFDLRQTKMLKMFFDPKDKKHFSNAYRSALDAGYSKAYAQNITVQAPWLEDAIVEILGNPIDKKNLVIKSKKVLDKALDSDDLAISTRVGFFVLGSEKEFSAKSSQETVSIQLTPLIDLTDRTKNGNNDSIEKN